MEISVTLSLTIWFYPSRFSHHQVSHAVIKTLAMNGWHLGKLATEADEITQLHRRSDVTLQLLENLGCRKILAQFDIIGQVEIEIEIFGLPEKSPQTFCCSP